MRFSAFLFLALSIASICDASDPAVDYLQEIKPLLSEKCAACHGVLKQEAGLRLDHRDLLLAGGDSGPAVDLDDVSASLLLERVQSSDDDLRMPPLHEGTPFTTEQIDLLKKWLQQGAKAPEEDIIQSPLDHWAFQSVDLSSATGTSVAGNPIDEYLNRRHAEYNLIPQSAAPRHLLLRRLYLNLIGLPPTVEQLNDQRSVEEIADELLQSPQHAERWARHWMDVWRYSDWYGLGKQLRYSQKHMWRWRDWIVQSLQQDKGYDRMIQEMLAGDELDPANPDTVAGTGFLARNYYLFNRTTWLDQTIEHTGKAFLGLTFNCAKCHDHKYDPISQVDYYQFRAFFEPHHIRLDPVPGVIDFEKDGLPRAFDRFPDRETKLHRRGNPKDPDHDLKITPSIPALFADQQPEIARVSLPPEAFAIAARDDVVQGIRESITAAIAKAEADVRSARTAIDGASLNDFADDEVLWMFRDEFLSLSEEQWQVVGDWVAEDGVIRRTTATREPEYLKLRQPHPDDFQVTCHFTTTGGTTYKSVTFRFDESDDRQFANFVYTSAHEAGPKVQVAETRQGKSNYPANGRANKPINVGEPQKLKFAVRGRLVNVWLNDELVIAYRLSDRGTSRGLSLSGFDATVDFDSIEIASLPEAVSLVSVDDDPNDGLSREATLDVAKKKLAWDEQRLREFEISMEAERIKVKQALGQTVSNAADVFHGAAIEKALLAIRQVEWTLAKAVGDPKQQATIRNGLAEAEAKLKATREGKQDYRSPMLAWVALTGPDDDRAKHETMFAAESTGRRLALARWIASPRNPLTARVAVNHVWMRHFGEPLVESVFDFGLRCEEPVHRELLDRLAAEFIQSGYSFRALHRMIVTSDAYARSSTTQGADAATVKRDPANEFLWRMNTRRMESQVIRDSLLHLAGTLDLTVGGPSVTVGPSSQRRSLYFLHSRDQQDQFLTQFDDADLLQCYRRDESVVPQQALALANSELALDAAEQIAERLTKAEPGQSTEAFIDRAFRMLLARSPGDLETAACVEFCEELDELLVEDVASERVRLDRVRRRLVESLLNHNDFISIR